MTATLPAVETFTCECCGFAFERPRKAGPKPRTCPECPVPSARNQNKRISPVPGPDNSPGLEHLALAVTEYRLAIEQARAGIRIGRLEEALAALDAAVAPRPGRAAA